MDAPARPGTFEFCRIPESNYALLDSDLTEGAASVVGLSVSVDFDGSDSELPGRASSPEKTLGSNVSARVGWKSAKESTLEVGEVSMKKEVGLKGWPLVVVELKESLSAANMLDVVGVFKPIIPWGARSREAKLSWPAMGDMLKNCCCITGSTDAATELVDKATARRTVSDIQSSKKSFNIWKAPKAGSLRIVKSLII